MSHYKIFSDASLRMGFACTAYRVFRGGYLLYQGVTQVESDSSNEAEILGYCVALEVTPKDFPVVVHADIDLHRLITTNTKYTRKIAATIDRFECQRLTRSVSIQWVSRKDRSYRWCHQAARGYARGLYEEQQKNKAESGSSVG